MIYCLRVLFLIGLCFCVGCSVVDQAVLQEKEKDKENPYGKRTIPYDPLLYRDVEEAARTLQAELKDLRIVEMLPSASGYGYDPVAVPIQAFLLGPRSLTLKYTVPRMKEKTETFPLETIRLSEGIMTPSPKDPTWSVWVIMPHQGGLPSITTLCAPTQAQAEVLYRALLSLMAAAGNRWVPKDKVPPTLSFALPPAPAPGKSGAPKLGFALLPVQEAGKEGLLVTDVEKGSPAERAGLKAGDELLAVNGTEVRNAQEVAAALKPQENLLTLARDGKVIEIRIVIPVSF